MLITFDSCSKPREGILSLPALRSVTHPPHFATQSTHRPRPITILCRLIRSFFIFLGRSGIASSRHAIIDHVLDSFRLSERTKVTSVTHMGVGRQCGYLHSTIMYTRPFKGRASLRNPWKAKSRGYDARIAAMSLPYCLLAKFYHCCLARIILSQCLTSRMQASTSP
ncbi:hypothetical protein EV356DRAFT_8933 [Viridothelium virens]|uniref:Uncharacterized protein n=1 Tax=Viridothelium virens TaxID=1048519 RepID=A0A6A6HPW4_VIRVR|nr:hypothetical protein EV356DRAFT_8933 [Viridothelium virens]